MIINVTGVVEALLSALEKDNTYLRVSGILQTLSDMQCTII